MFPRTPVNKYISFEDNLFVLRKTGTREKPAVSTSSGTEQGRQRAKSAKENSTAPLPAAGLSIIYIFNLKDLCIHFRTESQSAQLSLDHKTVHTKRFHATLAAEKLPILLILLLVSLAAVLSLE